MKNNKTKKFPSYKDIISLRLGKKKNIEVESAQDVIIEQLDYDQPKQKFINTTQSKWFY